MRKREIQNGRVVTISARDLRAFQTVVWSLDLVALGSVETQLIPRLALSTNGFRSESRAVLDSIRRGDAAIFLHVHSLLTSSAGLSVQVKDALVDHGASRHLNALAFGG